MANLDTISGFKPVGHLLGGPWNGKVNAYYVPVGNATALFKGDAVKSAGSADASGKYPTVAQAAAGEVIRGVIIGFGDWDQRQHLKYSEQTKGKGFLFFRIFCNEKDVIVIHNRKTQKTKLFIILKLKITIFATSKIIAIIAVIFIRFILTNSPLK